MRIQTVPKRQQITELNAMSKSTPTMSNRTLRVPSNWLFIAGMAALICACFVVLLYRGPSAANVGPNLDAAGSDEASVPPPVSMVVEEVHASLSKVNPNNAARDLAALRKDVTDLKNEVGALRRWVREQTVAAIQTARDDAQDWHTDSDPERADVELALSYEEQQIEFELEWQSYIETVDISFEEERVDTSWSAEITSAIYDVMETETLSETILDHVECRSSLCRIELRHDEPMVASHAQTFLLSRLAGVLPDATMEHFDEGEGKSRTIVYLAREGYSLPSLDP